MSKSAIYRILNKTTNKYYIGSAVNVKRRWYKHRLLLSANKHGNPYLQNAWNKYGEESFIFEVLEYVLQGSLSKSEFRVPLLAREQYYKDLYKSYDRKYGYDICKVAGSRLGTRHSDETKKKLSLIRLEKYTGKNHPMYGKHHSNETKMKQKIASQGNKYATGYIRSPETRLKDSIAKKGITWSKERRLKRLNYSAVFINQIRKEYEKNKITFAKLSERFSVSKSFAWNVIKGKTLYEH